MNNFSFDLEACLSRLAVLRRTDKFQEIFSEHQNRSGLKIERGDYSDVLDWDVAEDRGMTLEKIRRLCDMYSFSDLEFLSENRSDEEKNRFDIFFFLHN